MIKIWIYAIVLVLLAVIGLALGSGNSETVTFDYLLGRAQMPVSSVLVIGVVFGMICGFYLALIFCWREWRQARSARSELKAARKAAAALSDAKPQKS